AGAGGGGRGGAPQNPGPHPRQTAFTPRAGAAAACPAPPHLFRRLDGADHATARVELPTTLIPRGSGELPPA
ncbi:hypothetical protein ACFWIP_38670, partial [Streptomyces anulatus]